MMNASVAQQSQTPAERLRQATWERHQQIEKCAPLRRVFAKDYQLVEYAQLLERFYGFYQVVEPLLETVLAAPSEAPFRRPAKCPLLVADVEGLGHPKLGPDTVPMCFYPPQIETPTDAIGVAYVLEGSTMGGGVISRYLAGHFGDAVGQSLGFYSSYGEAALANWMAFKEHLNQRFSHDEKGIVAVIRAVDATYLSLTDWLEQTF
jgi:heme oxygenase